MRDKILVIATYPPRGTLHAHKHSAVAFYTKNTLMFARKVNTNLDFLVLADKEVDGKVEIYEDDGIKVKRIWKWNSFSSYISLIKEIFRNKDRKKILFEFEWSMLGSKRWLVAFLPFFLLFLKITGKQVFFVSHAVLLDANDAVAQIGVPPKSFYSSLLSFALRFLYRSIISLSFRVIVFEEGLKQRLLQLGGSHEKVTVIPFGVERGKKVGPRNRIRTKLGIKDDEFVVMNFGFLAWYKGSDWLVDTFSKFFKENPSSRLRLLVVGGETAKYMKDPIYKKFVKDIYRKSKEARGKILVTGFIPEGTIADYFTASDLVILPYRVFVSSSGPLSFAFSYKKPFLISDRLDPYFESQDTRDALEKVELVRSDLEFSFLEEELFKKVEKVRSDFVFCQKLIKFSSILAESRYWEKVGEKYARELI